MYWRWTSDIIGRRIGKHKLPYNPDKSVEGSAAIALAGFVASVLYMHYSAIFGFIEESLGMVVRFFLLPFASAVIDSFCALLSTVFYQYFAIIRCFSTVVRCRFVLVVAREEGLANDDGSGFGFFCFDG